MKQTHYEKIIRAFQNLVGYEAAPGKMAKRKRGTDHTTTSIGNSNSSIIEDALQQQLQKTVSQRKSGQLHSGNHKHTEEKHTQSSLD